MAAEVVVGRSQRMASTARDAWQQQHLAAGWGQVRVHSCTKGAVPRPLAAKMVGQARFHRHTASGSVAADALTQQQPPASGGSPTPPPPPPPPAQRPASPAGGTPDGPGGKRSGGLDLLAAAGLALVIATAMCTALNWLIGMHLEPIKMQLESIQQSQREQSAALKEQLTVLGSKMEGMQLDMVKIQTKLEKK